MSRILYGVSGEGAGHSSRAREIVPHLLTGGHDVRLVSYDRGYRVHTEIRRFHPDVVITDFEPMTAWLARCHGLPLIADCCTSCGRRG